VVGGLAGCQHRGMGGDWPTGRTDTHPHDGTLDGACPRPNSNLHGRSFCVGDVVTVVAGIVGLFVESRGEERSNLVQINRNQWDGKGRRYLKQAISQKKPACERSRSHRKVMWRKLDCKKTHQSLNSSPANQKATHLTFNLPTQPSAHAQPHTQGNPNES
jgi:hypothetical protein